MEFTELLELLKTNPEAVAKVKSLLTNNRPYKQTEDVTLCLCCQKNKINWLDMCNPCLDAGEVS